MEAIQYINLQEKVNFTANNTKGEIMIDILKEIKRPLKVDWIKLKKITAHEHAEFDLMLKKYRKKIIEKMIIKKVK